MTLVTQWVVASGGNLRESNSYRLGDTAGETAASSANAFTSANFTLSSGFWSQISGTLPPAPPPPPPTPITPTPSPSPTPGPTPTPQPGGFGLNINSSDPATNNPTVIVNAWGPNVTRMRLDNQNEYADEGWISYQPTTTWMISTAGEYITPRYVYGWFKDAQDVVYGPYFDSIIYDPVAPQGSVMILGGEFVTVPLWLDAWDDNSGVNQMRIAEDADLTDAAWQPYTNTVIWVLQNPVVYAQFHDQASNQSLIYGSDGSSQASDSRPISISITGPAIGITDQEHALLATVDPITATRPITYTWQATGQTPVTHTNSMQVSDAISFTWSATGMQTITVTASNRIGSASGVFNIVISTGACDIFLPVVLRQWP